MPRPDTYEPAAPEAGTPSPDARERTPVQRAENVPAAQGPREVGGPKGPEPTRYGDWERGGRCIDF